MIEKSNDFRKLPQGWVWTSLGEVCLRPQYGWTTRAAKEGKTHLLRTSDITSGNIDWDSVPYCEKDPPDIEKYVLKDGDIVVSRAGSVGYSHLIKNPQKAVFASYLIRFKPMTNDKYVAYFLKSPSYWQSISEKSIGIAIPNVNATKLKRIAFPLPPLPEQCRISWKIEELFTRLDAGVDSLRKVKTQLQCYRQTALKCAFEGKLTEEWRKSHKHEVEPASKLLEHIKEERRKNVKGKLKGLPSLDTKELPKLPVGWCWVNFSMVINRIKRGPSMKCNREGKGIRYITSGNLRNGVLKLDLDYKFLEGFDNIDKCQLIPGDLILNCVNSLEQVGKSAVFKNEHGKAIVGFNNYALELNNNFILSYYANFFCQSNLFKKQIYFLIKQAVNQVSFATRELDFIAIPIPPLAEEHKIVEELDSLLSVIDEVERVAEQSLIQSEWLRQSILKEAFEGRLVPHDPTDEPAEKLLEWIREEKEYKSEKNVKKKSKREKKRKQVELVRYVK